MIQVLFGLSNIVSLFAAVVILFASILALRHVGQGGAVLMLIGAGCQLLVSLFWTLNSLGGYFGRGSVINLGPEVFGVVSILSSGALLMWGVGAVLVLFRVGAILKQHLTEQEIQAREAARGGI